ncbi:MAG: hypothetical protein OEW15_06980 [Nitrospirota bacterium]|nr:hypothetical protein [Nitrospirota bacterium]
MKQLSAGAVLIAALLMATIIACTDDKNPAQQYGTTMVNSLKSAKSVEDKAHADAARKAIQDFHVTNGRYPADLAELLSATGLPLKSDAYDYDPSTGTLTKKN